MHVSDLCSFVFFFKQKTADELRISDLEFRRVLFRSPQGDRAVSASFDCSLILWNLENQEAIEVLDDHEGAVNAVALVDGGRHAISASDDGTVRLWEDRKSVV